MNTTNIYADIATRTQGDIYIGVVGPVRTGKSTFIKRFMETLVIPNISGEFQKERATDELPQSSAGKTIMTTEPKFVPENGVTISFEEHTKMNVRLIDCVGYIVPSALGYIENEQPRMVATPWFEEEVPFNMAAEVGTQKVITDHSTIGLVVTTDGSISDIPRHEYEEAEEKVISQLKQINKPFLILLNSVNPTADATIELAESLSEKYGVAVVPTNCVDLTEDDIKSVLSRVLEEFPVKEVRFDMPKWAFALPKDHWLKSSIVNSVFAAAENIVSIRDIRNMPDSIAACEYIETSEIFSMDLSTGSAVIGATLKKELFYRIIGEQTGIEISGEEQLMNMIVELSKIRQEYSKYMGAIEQVMATGYGIVMPNMDELLLQEPEIVKQGGKYGIRLKASAPSIHMMKADITTEVAPIVGSEKQSEELVNYLLSEFEESPEKIWSSNIFGKSLHELVNEGLHNKLYRMPSDSRMKL